MNPEAITNELLSFVGLDSSMIDSFTSSLDSNIICTVSDAVY